MRCVCACCACVCGCGCTHLVGILFVAYGCACVSVYVCMCVYVCLSACACVLRVSRLVPGTYMCGARVVPVYAPVRVCDGRKSVPVPCLLCVLWSVCSRVRAVCVRARVLCCVHVGRLCRPRVARACVRVRASACVRVCVLCAQCA